MFVLGDSLVSFTQSSVCRKTKAKQHRLLINISFQCQKKMAEETPMQTFNLSEHQNMPLFRFPKVTSLTVWIHESKVLMSAIYNSSFI